MSDNLKVTCGVPQRFKRGVFKTFMFSFLFLLYINDLPTTSTFNITLFADDTLVMLSD